MRLGYDKAKEDSKKVWNNWDNIEWNNNKPKSQQVRLFGTTITEAWRILRHYFKKWRKK